MANFGLNLANFGLKLYNNGQLGGCRGSPPAKKIKKPIRGMQGGLPPAKEGKKLHLNR